MSLGVQQHLPLPPPPPDSVELHSPGRAKGKYNRGLEGTEDIWDKKHIPWMPPPHTHTQPYCRLMVRVLWESCQALSPNWRKVWSSAGISRGQGIKSIYLWGHGRMWANGWKLCLSSVVKGCITVNQLLRKKILNLESPSIANVCGQF